MPLIVDCCSLVHGKALADLSPTPLDLIDRLVRSGLPLVTTPRVLQELKASSLESTLAPWEASRLLTMESARRQEVRELRNLMKKRDIEPGNNDKELIAVARRLGAPLLTHDHAASQLARRTKLTVVDLTDMVALAGRLDLADLAVVDSAWGSLEGRPWPFVGPSWSGSLHATLSSRPRLTQVLDVLAEQVHPALER